MNELIAYCGLDCARCEARTATVNDDPALRRDVAAKWSELNGVAITPEMINCMGCRAAGPKTVYCDSLCPIRKCAAKRGVSTCAACQSAGNCEKLGALLSHSEEAAENIRRMREKACFE